LSLIFVSGISGCSQMAQWTKKGGESCRMSLCDCKCHTGPITEDTGALCGINCARYGNGIVGCEVKDGQCTPTYDYGLQARYTCFDLCRAAQSKNISLENGPCLSDNAPEWNISDWVCDVAHSPRTAEDNLKENQCSSWLNKTAKQFIELTPECELIKAA